MPRSAAPASGVIRWIASVAGRAGYLTALLLAVQSVLALCGVGYALILRALIDAATAGQTQTFVRSAIWLVSLNFYCGHFRSWSFWSNSTFDDLSQNLVISH